MIKKRFIGLLFFLLLMPSVASADENEMIGTIGVKELTFYSEAGASLGVIKSMGSEIRYIPTQSPNRVKITVGQITAYVNPQFILAVGPAESESVYVGKWELQSNQTYTLFEKADKLSTVRIFGTSANIFQVSQLVDGFYEVHVNGKTLYMSSEEGQVLFKDNVSAFKILNQNLPYYKYVDGKYIRVGTLSAGSSWNRIRSQSVYHQLKIGMNYYYVPRIGTYPIDQQVSFTKVHKAIYPKSLMTEVQTAVTTVDNKPLGIVGKGAYVTILSMNKQYGQIEFMGTIGQIELNKLRHYSILSPKKTISHDEMVYTMTMFANMYPEFTKLEQIGKSVEGRPILALKVGNGKKEILFDAALHAREHMTTNVLLEMIDTYTHHYYNGTSFKNYKVRQTLDQVSIWFVPMMNPDGVTLVQRGIYGVKNGQLAKSINSGSTNFARWKANVRGVDLNRNFDGPWALIKNSPAKPAYMNYKGPKVFSEPESIALRDFVNRHSFRSNISYHSSGNILFWFNFQGSNNYKRDFALTTKIRAVTGQSIMPPLYQIGSGSSADWFILTKKMPGITVEIAPFAGEKPVPLIYWDRVWAQHQTIGLLAATEANTR